ncbi:hypothetical protein QL093DRAFT_2326179 [Fusarium oxysporum]|nr:hypothetical protein QL093DRAFT_2326179 [Fusarium oxysporum]
MGRFFHFSLARFSGVLALRLPSEAHSLTRDCSPRRPPVIGNGILTSTSLIEISIALFYSESKSNAQAQRLLTDAARTHAHAQTNCYSQRLNCSPVRF